VCKYTVGLPNAARIAAMALLIGADLPHFQWITAFRPSQASLTAALTVLPASAGKTAMIALVIRTIEHSPFCLDTDRIRDATGLIQADGRCRGENKCGTNPVDCV
jgi:hypothetical protein